MATKNYLEQMTSDIKDYLENEFDWKTSIDDFYDIEDLGDYLNDELFNNDNITGNASGSYFFNRYESMKMVLGNMDECTAAIKEFGIDSETVAKKFLNEDWEYFDVTIRCYLLGQAIGEVIGEIKEDFEKAKEESEE